jgi:drug/metabolite transporter (DMT)-like permease
MHAWAVMGVLMLSLIWGGSFAAMKVALNAGLSVGAMLGLRFTLAALCLGVMLRILRIRIQRQALLDGLWMGLLLTAIFWLQSDGLRYTTTSKSGFITGLYVVFTPLLSLLTHHRPRLSHGLGACVAAGGLFLLVRDPGQPMGGWNFGDSETLLCAIGCGAHIVMTGLFGRRSNGWVLAFVQISTVALLSWLLTSLVPSVPLRDGSTLGGFSGLSRVLVAPQLWGSLAYQSLLATALAFTLMTTLQKHLGATEAAIIYSLEPVVTALLAMSGRVIGIREALSPSQLVGGAVILSAMLLAELGPRLWRAWEADAEGIG